VFLTAFVISHLSVPAVRGFARRTGIYDFPAQRKVHAHPTPLLGGVAIFASFTLTLLANGILSPPVKAVLIAGSIIFIAGVLDDVWGLSAGVKFLCQIAAALVLPVSGIHIDILPGAAVWQAAETVLTVLWIVGITNAFNFMDGMDGLAGGIAAIACFFFGLIGMWSGQEAFLLISMALLGGALGFLPYNFRQMKSATIFLGDTGSTFTGFMLASLAVMGEWAEGDPLRAISVPLLVLGVLILDMAYTTIARILLGKVKSFTEWIEYTGKDHLHHRLHAMGLSQKESVFFIYVLTVILGVGAVVVRRTGSTEVFLEIFQAVGVFSMVAILMLRKGK
jgi:UDP-GlcNAc:undecaprenyl-phosphate GlcNAc-1-phosphate transferase